MKKLNLFLLAIPCISWACPDLSGKYFDSSGTYEYVQTGCQEVRFTNFDRNGTMLSQSTWIADGTVRTLPDPSNVNSTIEIYIGFEVDRLRITSRTLDKPTGKQMFFMESIQYLSDPNTLVEDYYNIDATGTVKDRVKNVLHRK